jgi:hypothetical protein
MARPFRGRREAIRHKVQLGAMVGGESVLALAREWLREKELEQEQRERRLLGYAKWAWDAAFAAAVLTAIGLGVALWLGLRN